MNPTNIEKIIIGFHISVEKKHYHSVIQKCQQLGINGCQIWLGNNKSYYSKLLEKEEYEPIYNNIKKTGFFLIAHSPYILNFARPLINDNTGQKALDRYIRDLVNIKNLGGIGCVLHMGSNVLNLPIKECYATFIKNLEWVVENMPNDVYIILENMAGGGKRMCCKMKEWADFWNLVPNKLRDRILWCIDTAHLYAAGEYDISKKSESIRFYNDFSKLIGWDYVLCFHFNGSKSKFASHIDNHADIGYEKAGEIEIIGLKELAFIAGKTVKPLILEIPGDTYTTEEQTSIIKSWFNY
jgi:deoxyribonuclease IV